jgi:hypothetical protein
MLQVVLNDGFHSDADESDDPFTVEDQPPQARIVRPSDGDAFAADQRVSFRAATWDPEQGSLDASAVAWASDLDGDLGTGNPLDAVASALTPGDHVITATVADDSGLEASATINITIHADHPDSDLDGIPDGPDNCRDDANEDQADADGDGRGDVCDVAGDMNGDGDVDDTDRDLFNASFGLGIGDLGFEPAADLDEDGTVTFADYQLWLQAYEAAQAASAGSATPVCGLTGAELLIPVAGALAWRRRGRRMRRHG